MKKDFQIFVNEHNQIVQEHADGDLTLSGLISTKTYFSVTTGLTFSGQAVVLLFDSLGISLTRGAPSNITADKIASVVDDLFSAHQTERLVKEQGGKLVGLNEELQDRNKELARLSTELGTNAQIIVQLKGDLKAKNTALEQCQLQLTAAQATIKQLNSRPPGSAAAPRHSQVGLGLRLFTTETDCLPRRGSHSNTSQP